MPNVSFLFIDSVDQFDCFEYLYLYSEIEPISNADEANTQNAFQLPVISRVKPKMNSDEEYERKYASCIKSFQVHNTRIAQHFVHREVCFKFPDNIRRACKKTEPTAIAMELKKLNY